MIPVVGVFESRSDAQQSGADLRAAGIPQDNINILTPEFTEQERARVPAVAGEQPGMVKAIAAVAGGAAGFGVGEALATLLVPGVGVVLAIGAAGGALLGGVVGGSLGGAAERAIFPGLPEDELFVYMDALRQGRTAVVTMAADQKQAEMVRKVFEHAGAESVDRAREMWWLGMRDVEREHYEAGGGNFQHDEHAFRNGFEAALKPENRDKSYEERSAELCQRYPDVWNSKPFRSGYDRGCSYLKTFKKD